jgi:IS30 family transposase
MSEREDILAGIERGRSIRQIAKGLGRAPSTVLRELRRNMPRLLYRSRSRLVMRQKQPFSYRPSRAQARAKRLASRPKTAKLAKNAVLRDLVQAKLKRKFSPEQISRQLREQFPDDPEMQVSHETIYKSLLRESA